LESEEGAVSLPEWVSTESLITFHLQPGEVATLQFFEPLLRGKQGAKIFLIKDLTVCGMVGFVGGATTFVEEGASAASDFIKSILKGMEPKIQPTITFEEEFGENDSSSAPQEEIGDLDVQRFYAVGALLPEGGESKKNKTTMVFGSAAALTPAAPPNEGEKPKLIIVTEKTKGRRVQGDDITQPLDPVQLEEIRNETAADEAKKLAMGDTSPLGQASIPLAVSVQGEVSQVVPRGEPSGTAVIKHQPQQVMKARMLDPFRLLWAEFQLALLRRKMKRLAARKKQEPPKLLEKGRALTKKMEELGKRLGIGEQMQREMNAGRFSLFVSLIRRIRKW
jgi:hypothetical protein